MTKNYIVMKHITIIMFYFLNFNVIFDRCTHIQFFFVPSLCTYKLALLAMGCFSFLKKIMHRMQTGKAFHPFIGRMRVIGLRVCCRRSTARSQSFRTERVTRGNGWQCPGVGNMTLIIWSASKVYYVYTWMRQNPCVGRKRATCRQARNQTSR